MAEYLQVLAYDAAGNLVGNFFPDAEEPNYSIVEFDENGNKVHSAVYMGEELLTESVWTYDADDRETSWEIWIDGALSSAETYAYTPQPDGTLLCSITTRWPQTGQVTESSYLTNSTGQFLMSEEDGTASHGSMTTGAARPPMLSVEIIRHSCTRITAIPTRRTAATSAGTKAMKAA